MKFTAILLLLGTEWLAVGTAKGPWSMPRGGTSTRAAQRPVSTVSSPLTSWGLSAWGLQGLLEQRFQQEQVDDDGNRKNDGDHDKPKNDNDMRVEVIEPGLVVIRNFLSERECKRVAKHAFALGKQGEDGFYTKNEQGEVILNTGENRGRIYDDATRFPKGVTDYCNKAVKAARDIDSKMPEMKCTHVLLNMYTTTEGLVWHRDIYENDGTSDHPVVNLCVGASCVFGLKHKDHDPVRTVTLRSGDVILFGGPCRLIKHAVLKVNMDDCPDWMEVPCRFSFTFRDSPEVLGRESEFKYFRVKEHLVGQETFKAPSDPKQFRGLPDHNTQHASQTVCA